MELRKCSGVVSQSKANTNGEVTQELRKEDMGEPFWSVMPPESVGRADHSDQSFRFPENSCPESEEVAVGRGLSVSCPGANLDDAASPASRGRRQSAVPDVPSNRGHPRPAPWRGGRGVGDGTLREFGICRVAGPADRGTREVPRTQRMELRK